MSEVGFTGGGCSSPSVRSDIARPLCDHAAVRGRIGARAARRDEVVRACPSGTRAVPLPHGLQRSLSARQTERNQTERSDLG